jgi:arabinofuranosyltransferase
MPPQGHANVLTHAVDEVQAPRQEWVGGLALGVLTAAYLAWTVRWNQAPTEDAAMLLRYAEHVAQSHGFVWNVGDPPLDGATDFLFVVAVAAVARLGASVETAARLLGAVAHLVTVFLVYFVPRRLFRASRVLCAAIALFVAAGPAKLYIASAFGTTFFGVWVALLWTAALVAMERRSQLADGALPVLACLLGMARPEGAILGVAVMMSVAASRGPEAARTFARFALWFGVLGGAYFLARWRYFGHPLPNPFYVKGGGHLYWSSLKAAGGNAVRLAGPLLTLLPLGVASATGRRRLLLLAWPLAVFIGAWLLLSNEMNYAMRFQYAVLPIIAIAVPGIAAGADQAWRERVWPLVDARWRVALTASAAVAVALMFMLQHRIYAPAPNDSRREAGMLLAAYRDRGYTMAVSEAGLLPFYSGWRAIDAWGLNDEAIARTGHLTEEYLEASRPALIMFHAYSSPIVPLQRAPDRWDTMVMVLRDFAEARGYRLAASFGVKPDDTHTFYVRPDLPDADRLVDAIRAMQYYYVETGELAVDFAHLGR